MFFQAPHSLLDEEFFFFQGTAIEFPLHIHRSFEYFGQISGQTEITVDDKQYVLKQGEAVLIFPYQAHSYRKLIPGSYQIGFISPEIVPEYYNAVKNMMPKDNRFSYLHALNGYADNRCLIKSDAYRICGEFHRNREYQYQQGMHDDIIRALLLFVDEHFEQDCTLKEAASCVGYDYAYVSKYFKRKTGIAFNRYVNIIRVNRAKSFLLTTQKTALQIGQMCGFHNSRTFYREFTDIVGLTPKEYRAAQKDR